MFRWRVDRELPATRIGQLELGSPLKPIPSCGDVRRHVVRSTDRGATWSYVVATPTTSDIVFLTPTRWLQIVRAESSYQTTDAGASWHSFATDYGKAAPFAAQIVFGDAQTGYATVRGGIQRTTDGGKHWMHLTTPGTRASTP
jgi:photosystem II stability/assembly factor-like uncharacterized protein